jgi:uncharacterized membrane protein YphA (DoxX/SURF4 family)
MRRLTIVLRVFMAVVFLYAAYTKLREPWMMFAMAIDAYRLLPQWAVLTAGRTLPAFELLLGLVLLSGIALRYAAAASTMLLGSFFVIMVITFAKGMSIDCGCFGGGDVIGVKTLLRDGLLLAASGALTWLAFRTRPFMQLQPSSAT